MTAELNNVYAEANKRFDEREIILLKKGFKRVIVKEYNVAIYVNDTDKLLRRFVIQSGFMLYAPDEVFNEAIKGY